MKTGKDKLRELHRKYRTCEVLLSMQRTHKNRSGAIETKKMMREINESIISLIAKGAKMPHVEVLDTPVPELAEVIYQLSCSSVPFEMVLISDTRLSLDFPVWNPDLGQAKQIHTTLSVRSIEGPEDITVLTGMKERKLSEMICLIEEKQREALSAQKPPVPEEKP